MKTTTSEIKIQILLPNTYIEFVLWQILYITAEKKKNDSELELEDIQTLFVKKKKKVLPEIFKFDEKYKPQSPRSSANSSKTNMNQTANDKEKITKVIRKQDSFCT